MSEFVMGFVSAVAVGASVYAVWYIRRDRAEIAAQKDRLTKALRIIASLAEEMEARQPMAAPKAGQARALAVEAAEPSMMDRAVASLKPTEKKRKNFRPATYEEEWALEQRALGFTGCDDSNPDLSRAKAEALIREYHMTRER